MVILYNFILNFIKIDQVARQIKLDYFIFLINSKLILNYFYLIFNFPNYIIYYSQFYYQNKNNF